MKINIINKNNTPIAVIESNEIVINELDDAVDLLGNCDYLGTSKIIIQKEHLNPDFFELKTGLAGEILQKFSNYRKKLAIVGIFSEYTSKSLRDFIYESNKMGRISFVHSIEEAEKTLVK